MRTSDIRMHLQTLKSQATYSRQYYDKAGMPDTEENDEIGRCLDALLEACDTAMSATASKKVGTGQSYTPESGA